jgi:hypothetical protein
VALPSSKQPEAMRFYVSNPQVVAKLIEQAQGADANQLHARSNRLGCAEIRREKVSSTPYLGRP